MIISRGFRERQVRRGGGKRFCHEIAAHFHEHFSVVRRAHVHIVVEICKNAFAGFGLLANKFCPRLQFVARVIVLRAADQTVKADLNEIRRDGKIHRHTH